jgi:hypothetical protein
MTGQRLKSTTIECMMVASYSKRLDKSVVPLGAIRVHAQNKRRRQIGGRLLFQSGANRRALV